MGGQYATPITLQTGLHPGDEARVNWPLNFRLPDEEAGMTSRTDRQIQKTRNIILGLVALVAVLIVGYGIFYSTGATTGEIVAGEHYTVLENPPRQRPGQPIVVHEYFSYACIHCRNFEPLVKDWQKGLPDNVTFVRSPVIFSAIWKVLAQSYYALDSIGALEANHDRLFRAIHDNGREFRSAEAIADYIDGNGTTKAEFLRAFESAEVRRATRDAEQRQRAVNIASVPTLVIGEKYLVNMDAGRKTALEIADHLIALENAPPAVTN
jgi:thiol:disulfide interchange protein DsbA